MLLLRTVSTPSWTTAATAAPRCSASTLVDNEPPTFDGDFEILLECDLFQEDVNFGGVLGLNNIQGQLHVTR